MPPRHQDSDVTIRVTEKEILAQCPDAVVVHDGAAILWVNDTACGLTGFSRKELIGKPFLDFVDPRRREMIKERFAARLRGEPVPNVYELAFLKRDGTIIDAEVAIRLVTHDRPYVIAFIRDIRERVDTRRTIGELEERVQTLRRIGSLTTMVAGIGDKLPQILDPIEECLRQLEARSDERSDCPTALLAGIRKEVERGRILSERLFSFGRMARIDLKPVVIDHFIKRIESRIRKKFRQSDCVTFALHCEGCQAFADAGLLSKVMVDIADNAARAIERDGWAEIITTPCFLDESFVREHPGATKGSHIKISFSDTGPGVPPEILEHVFEPFFTTRRDENAWGLGLSAAFGVVKQHRGYIQAISAPAQGTRIVIFLPSIPPGEEEESVSPSIGDPAAPGKRILLAEDDDMIRDLILIVLRKAGHQVLAGRNGADCLEKAKEDGGPFDLLLTDVVMPGMNGRQLSEHIQAIFPGLKVLFISGYAEDVIAHHGILNSGVHFLAKPFSSAELRTKISEVLALPPSAES